MNTAPTGREALAVALLLGLLAVLLVGLGWHEGTDGFLSDDAVYLMMADYFSPYLAERSPHLGYLMQQSLFPPLYPLLLALAGAGSANAGPAHLLTALLFVGALLAFLLWVRREAGSTTLACLLTLLFALLPFSLVHVTEIWSESLYLLLVFSFLRLLPDDRDPENHEPLPLAASFIVGLALLTRSAAVALLPVLLLQLWRTNDDGRLRHLAIALALPLAWILLERSLFPGTGYLELLGGSLASLDPASFLTDELPARARALWLGWDAVLGGNGSRAPWTTALTGLVLAAGLFGLLRRLIGWRPDALFVTCHLGMLLLWSAPGHAARLLYPVVPLLLFYAVTLVGHATRPGNDRLRLAFCLLPVLAMAPASLAIGQRHVDTPPDLADANFAHTRYWLDRENAATARYDIDRRSALIRFLRSLDTEIPPGGCVYSAHVPLVMLHAGRASRLFPASPEPGNLVACDHFLVINFGSLGFEPMAPLQALHDLGAEVAATAHDGRDNIVAALLRRPGA
jgi:hypothetical protein